MLHELAILEGQIVDIDLTYTSNIGIDNGRITEIGKNIQGEKRIYANAKLIFPGYNDPHAHMRYGEEHKEDFCTGSIAAIHGGVTTAIDMPNTKPPTDNPDILRRKREKSRKEGKIDIFFYGLVLPNNLNSLQQMGPEVKGYKIYVGKSTGGFILPYEYLPKATEIIRRTNKPIVIHCEDQETIDLNTKKLQGENYPELHCDIRSPEAEIIAVEKVLSLVDYPVHIAHISTKGALDIIRRYRKNGYKVTCEVTPHHLLLTRADMRRFGNGTKVNPALRDIFDQRAMNYGLESGSIDVIATDHAPHTREEKESDNPPSGVTGLDTLGNVLSYLIMKRGVSPKTIMKVTSYNAAQIFGFRDRGRIAVGKKADITILDTHHPTKITEDILYTKCKSSPFIGREFPGAIMHTIFNGQIMSEYDQVFV